MTHRLVKGMYGSEFDPNVNLFGLSCGQMRSLGMAVKNSGWYNGVGERLGWGDLSYEDLDRIASELEEDETFIILPERAAFWNFVTKVSTIGSACSTKPEIDSPGIEYVMEYARFMIRKGKIERVDK